MNLFRPIEPTKFTKVINSILGYEGRMICASKSRYKENHPKGMPYFNACIFDDKGKQVWWGDIDVVLDKVKLKKIAKTWKKKFYVTPEHPYRTDFNSVTIKQLNEGEYVLKFNGGKK